jgi:hypothetical protein
MTGKNDPLIGDENGFKNKFNFYEMFCGSGAGGAPQSKSKGGKPFFITETAATIHIARTIPGTSTFEVPPNTEPDMRAQIKQAWWRQMLNETFLANHPKVKGLAFFEFIKHEEESYRDFSSLGNGSTQQSDYQSDKDMDGATLKAFKADLNGGIDKLILWANVNGPSGSGGSKTGVALGDSKKEGSAVSISSNLSSIVTLLYLAHLYLI